MMNEEESQVRNGPERRTDGAAGAGAGLGRLGRARD